MAADSPIEWCDSTDNFWEGCTPVSKAEHGGGGCDNCYAERMNRWLRAGENWGAGAPRRQIMTARRVTLSWQRNAAKFRAEHGRDRRVFVNSISDWLDNEVPTEWRVDMLDTIRLCPDVTFLLLSKRIGNWRKLLEESSAYRLAVVLADMGEPTRDALYQWLRAWINGHAPMNVWIGATMVNQLEFDRDAHKLLAVPAAVRFISVGPMLGPIVIPRELIAPIDGTSQHGQRFIDWAITEGESGPKARPTHVQWLRAFRDQCAAACLPFLHKQNGEWIDHDQPGVDMLGTPRSRLHRWPDGACSVRLTKAVTGRALDGVVHDGFPMLEAA